jgi:hypothetical protein
LLPLESTEFMGNFDDGNKPKTIANRDQKIRGIPSTTMLRLSKHARWNFEAGDRAACHQQRQSVAERILIRGTGRDLT